MRSSIQTISSWVSRLSFITFFPFSKSGFIDDSHIHLVVIVSLQSPPVRKAPNPLHRAVVLYSECCVFCICQNISSCGHLSRVFILQLIGFEHSKHFMISLLLNLFGCVLWPRRWSVLVTIQCELEENVYSLLLHEVVCRCQIRLIDGGVEICQVFTDFMPTGSEHFGERRAQVFGCNSDSPLLAVAVVFASCILTLLCQEAHIKMRSSWAVECLSLIHI